tara:strand:+ start:134 stop:595 length:462 start_codon:yes stop_codon:yes gene_type:complete
MMIYQDLKKLKIVALGLTLIMAVLVTPTLYAADMEVEMLNRRDDGAKMIYSVDIARVDVGDTITWVPTTKGHNVHFLAGPEGWDLPKKSKQNIEVAITFDTPGVYLYQCTPHASMGMIGLVVVGDDTSNIDAIKKAKVRGKSKKFLKKLLGEL